MSPVITRGIDIGSSTFQMVWNLVAPRAMEPSRKLSGMLLKASSVVRMTIGSARSPMVREPARMLSPKPRRLTKNAIPKSPKTIDGMPERLLVIILMKLTSAPLGAYSFIYMPLMTPTGKAKSALPSIRQRVPTIAGIMPPAVIPSVGASVRKDQLITPAPLTRMKPRIRKSIATTKKLKSLKQPSTSV